MLSRLADIMLCSISDDEVRDWDVPSEATHLRVTLPSSPESVVAMQERGFLLGDRTLLCAIGTRGAPASGSSRRARVEAVLEPADHEAMFDLARRSFPGDRRFYVTPDGSQEVAEAALRDWISGLDETFVCRVKGEFAGFLAPTTEPDGSLCVSLAATDERFRLAGVALALYSAAVSLAHERGASRLVGRISSRNMPVMNLYASLGAKFSDPVDVFLKEVR